MDHPRKPTTKNEEYDNQEFHEKTPKVREERDEIVAERKKSEIEGLPPFGSPTLRVPLLFLGLGPSPGSPTLRGATMTHTRLAKRIDKKWIGQNWFWPKLAGPKPSWPKIGLAQIGQIRMAKKRIGQSRSLPPGLVSCRNRIIFNHCSNHWAFQWFSESPIIRSFRAELPQFSAQTNPRHLSLHDKRSQRPCPKVGPREETHVFFHDLWNDATICSTSQV